MSAALRRAVDFAGGATQLARTLGVSHQAVHKWLQRGWVSPERATELCGLYGIPAIDLIRPELRHALAMVDAASINADLI
jgi:DNA-binding transcriptional regulator YdaS (Cro superfamily)